MSQSPIMWLMKVGVAKHRKEHIKFSSKEKAAVLEHILKETSYTTTSGSECKLKIGQESKLIPKLKTKINECCCTSGSEGQTIISNSRV